MTVNDVAAAPAGLQLDNVSKVYNGLTVLDAISLRVNDGAFACIVGPSGCGKTTLLRAVHGLTPVTSGDVLVGGTRVQGPDQERAVVFQGDSLLPWRTVLDNIALGLELSGSRRKRARAQAAEFLQLVGLADFGNYMPHQLSGGMRQRVNLARAMAVEPRILLMDEPFAALDAQTREVMQGELLSIWQAHAQTVLFVTHQIDEAIVLADVVFVLGSRPGRIIEQVPIRLSRPRDLEVKRSPEFQTYVDHVWELVSSDAERESRRVQS